MKDECGNIIHAIVNGWTIIGDRSCYILYRADREPLVCWGTLDAAKAMAAAN